MPFSFKSLEISEIILIEAKSFPDQRGYFMELFQSPTLQKLIDVDNNF